MWLVARHPVRAIGDAWRRRDWSREERARSLRSLAPRAKRIAAAGERHLHVHFADTAALDARRIGALLGLPYSVSAHAYDVFVEPRNLECKLGAASFATGPARYTIEHMKTLVSPAAGLRIQLLPVGVDTGRFRRRRSYPGGRAVLAVGRLIEKKGFRDLIEAAALLRDEESLECLRIVGGGPLRDELAGLVRDLGLTRGVEMLGARDHGAVRELMEAADVLAMPCVVAADGDRDSLPTVVYEALAMEIPVVATREVGLPEVIRPEWGRLVPPGDPEGLARGLAELLEIPPRERAAMGRAGREWVVAERDAAGQAAKLGTLIDESPGA
jgi:glycosyltransferase involved in cell wall biosynthesis